MAESEHDDTVKSPAEHAATEPAGQGQADGSAVDAPQTAIEPEPQAERERQDLDAVAIEGSTDGPDGEPDGGTPTREEDPTQPAQDQAGPLEEKTGHVDAAGCENDSASRSGVFSDFFGEAEAGSRADGTIGERATASEEHHYSGTVDPRKGPSLIPPDRKPPGWWDRHGDKVAMLEWAAAVALIFVALYYLYFLLFPPPGPAPAQPPPPPSREEFRARVRALPPIAADRLWQVEAKIGRWRRIVIHHSATDGGNPETFDRYHRQQMKFENGLGYHFVIGNGNGMDDGEVAVGHRWRDQLDGAHVKGPEKDNANSYSIGVVLVGNFETGMATEKQLAALKGLLGFLRTQYNIGLASIVGHNQASATMTACPGQWFFVDEVVLALANP